MNKNYILLGLYLTVSAYLYDVLINLYNQTPFTDALLAVNWGRIVFIGLLGAIVVHFLPNRQS